MAGVPNFLSAARNLAFGNVPYESNVFLVCNAIDFFNPDNRREWCLQYRSYVYQKFLP